MNYLVDFSYFRVVLLDGRPVHRRDGLNISGSLVPGNSCATGQGICVSVEATRTVLDLKIVLFEDF